MPLVDKVHHCVTLDSFVIPKDHPNQGTLEFLKWCISCSEVFAAEYSVRACAQHLFVCIASFGEGIVEGVAWGVFFPALRVLVEGCAVDMWSNSSSYRKDNAMCLDAPESGSLFKGVEDNSVFRSTVVDVGCPERRGGIAAGLLLAVLVSLDMIIKPEDAKQRTSVKKLRACLESGIFNAIIDNIAQAKWVSDRVFSSSPSSSNETFEKKKNKNIPHWLYQITLRATSVLSKVPPIYDLPKKVMYLFLAFEGVVSRVVVLRERCEEEGGTEQLEIYDNLNAEDDQMSPQRIADVLQEKEEARLRYAETLISGRVCAEIEKEDLLRYSFVSPEVRSLSEFFLKDETECVVGVLLGAMQNVLRAFSSSSYSGSASHGKTKSTLFSFCKATAEFPPVLHFMDYLLIALHLKEVTQNGMKGNDLSAKIFSRAGFTEDGIKDVMKNLVEKGDAAEAAGVWRVGNISFGWPDSVLSDHSDNMKAKVFQIKMHAAICVAAVVANCPELFAPPAGRTVIHTGNTVQKSVLLETSFLSLLPDAFTDHGVNTILLLGALAGWVEASVGKHSSPRRGASAERMPKGEFVALMVRSVGYQSGIAFACLVVALARVRDEQILALLPQPAHPPLAELSVYLASLQRNCVHAIFDSALTPSPLIFVDPVAERVSEVRDAITATMAIPEEG